jgi:hypothetical protein
MDSSLWRMHDVGFIKPSVAVTEHLSFGRAGFVDKALGFTRQGLVILENDQICRCVPQSKRQPCLGVALHQG